MNGKGLKNGSFVEVCRIDTPPWRIREGVSHCFLLLFCPGHRKPESCGVMFMFDILWDTYRSDPEEAGMILKLEVRDQFRN